MVTESPQASPPAPEVAYEWVKAFILALPREQDAFLNENVLAESTGTSRTPVREALLRLEAEGFIKRIPHKGAYVQTVSDSEVRALMQARSVVEKWAASTGRRTLSTQVEALQTLLSAQRDSLGDTARFIELDLEFHNHVVRAAGNSIISDFYASLRQRQQRVGVNAVERADDRGQAVLHEHQLIVDAIASGDEQQLLDAIESHLTLTLNAVLDN